MFIWGIILIFQELCAADININILPAGETAQRIEYEAELSQ